MLLKRIFFDEVIDHVERERHSGTLAVVIRDEPERPRRITGEPLSTSLDGRPADIESAIFRAVDHPQLIPVAASEFDDRLDVVFDQQAADEDALVRGKFPARTAAG